MAGLVTNVVLIREYSTVSAKVCSCCGKRSVYKVKYPSGPALLLCSWCDLALDDRWSR